MQIQVSFSIYISICEVCQYYIIKDTIVLYQNYNIPRTYTKWSETKAMRLDWRQYFCFNCITIREPIICRVILEWFAIRTKIATFRLEPLEYI